MTQTAFMKERKLQIPVTVAVWFLLFLPSLFFSLLLKTLVILCNQFLAHKKAKEKKEETSSLNRRSKREERHLKKNQKPKKEIKTEGKDDKAAFQEREKKEECRAVYSFIQ